MTPAAGLFTNIGWFSIMSDNCLLAKISQYGDLSAEEVELLEWIQKDEEPVEARQVLRREGDPGGTLHVVKSGWVYSYRSLRDGGRQVLELHLPGDLIGLPGIAFSTALTGVVALTGGVVCPFPKDRLSEIFGRSARLTSILFLIAMHEESLLLERLTSMGRRNAYQRLAHLIVELAYRRRHLEPLLAPRIEWPVTQDLLADLLGLSEVHVNRTLRRLRGDGLIETANRHLDLVDREGLIDAADFDRAYLTSDVSWFRG